MPALSKRIVGIAGDDGDGWELFARARALIAEGIEVVELTVGDPDIRTDPAILQHMHSAAMGGLTGYSDLSGVPALRRAVAARVQARSGVPTTAENVLITPGAQAALLAAHMAACDPGDVAVFCDPYYATYPGTLRGAGAVPRAVRCLPENGFRPQPDDLRAAATGARSLLINSPNNPTGAVYGPQTMKAIAEICRAADLWLISDEVYEAQVWEGQHLSPRSLPDMAERTLAVSSMSKGHAMTGSRVGWLVGPAALIERAGDFLTVNTYGVPGFVQQAALFALQMGDEFEHQVTGPFRRRRDVVRRVMAGQSVVGLHPAQGAMYAMLDIRATGLSGRDFARALLDETRIAVMPGESFGEAAAGHVRVALTVADDVLAGAVERLVAFAARLAELKREVS